MGAIDLREIEKIETGNIVKNLNWFYYGFNFDNIVNIMEKGILSKKHLNYPNPNYGSNGKHYISLSKDNDPATFIFDYYKHTYPMIILDDLEAIECKYNLLYYFLRYTPLPFRYSSWSGEYQVYSKILPDKFIGIECMAYEWAKDDELDKLKRFRYMLEMLKSLEVKLPIYDFSREEDNKVHQIDTEAFLELSKNIFDD